MLIVIPTYRRNECLRWVLQSLVRCNIERISEEIRVLVVNNYPPAASEITQIVDEFRGDKRFEWKILYRKKTLDPVENWYSAIFDEARDNEVVFINSDDDLLLPYSLQNRYDAITKKGSDVVLGQLGKDLFFSEAGARIYCPSPPAIQSTAAVEALDFNTLLQYAPWHLSNHCYRNTKALRQGYEKALEWCEALDWLDKHNRTIYMPLYLPMAVLLVGGDILGIPAEIILRGRDIDEMRQAPYGVPSWNHGFVHGCAWIILNNESLANIPELDAIRSVYRREYVTYLPTYWFDTRLHRPSILKTLRALEIGMADICTKSFIHGLYLQLMQITGLRAYRLMKQAKLNSLPTEIFLETLASQKIPSGQGLS